MYQSKSGHILYQEDECLANRLASGMHLPAKLELAIKNVQLDLDYETRTTLGVFRQFDVFQGKE